MERQRREEQPEDDEGAHAGAVGDTDAGGREGGLSEGERLQPGELGDGGELLADEEAEPREPAEDERRPERPGKARLLEGREDVEALGQLLDDRDREQNHRDGQVHREDEQHRDGQQFGDEDERNRQRRQGRHGARPRDSAVERVEKLQRDRPLGEHVLLAVDADAEEEQHARGEENRPDRKQELAERNRLAREVADDERQRRDERDGRDVREDGRDERVRRQEHGHRHRDEREFLERAGEHRADERRREKQEADGDDRGHRDDAPADRRRDGDGDSDRAEQVRERLAGDDVARRDGRDEEQFAAAVDALVEDARPVGLNHEVHRHEEGEREDERGERERRADARRRPAGVAAEEARHPAERRGRRRDR